MKKSNYWVLIIVALMAVQGCNWFGPSDEEPPADDFLQQNILTYYNILPSKFFLYEGFAEMKYDLHEKDGKWLTASIDEYEIEPIVDIEHGYIEILDEGTGGGSIHEIITLFRKADSSPLIGISLGGFDGLYQNFSTSFYAFESEKWIDVSNTVLPSIPFSSFLDEEYVEKHLNTKRRAYNILKLIYVLPQFGTDINVIVNESQLRFLVENATDLDAIEQFSTGDVEELFEIIGNIKYKSMILNWNKQKGLFQAGGKELIDNQFIEEIFEGIE